MKLIDLYNMAAKKQKIPRYVKIDGEVYKTNDSYELLNKDVEIDDHTYSCEDV